MEGPCLTHLDRFGLRHGNMALSVVAMVAPFQRKEHSMSTVTVSIGRNVGNVPLPSFYWDEFAARVRTIASLWGTVTYVDAAESVGAWDGVAEDSRTWVFAAPDRFIDIVVDELASVARSYGQDAIAVTTGTTILAGLVSA